MNKRQQKQLDNIYESTGENLQLTVLNIISIANDDVEASFEIVKFLERNNYKKGE